MVTTDQNLITAIIYDEDDANLFLKIKPFVNRILPITPNAHAILLECSVPLINTTDIYTDCRQAKVLARVRRTESELLSVLENEKHLGVASKETLRGIAHVLFSISASFWELVKYLGPCLLPDGKGWIKLVDPKEIHQFLLEHLQPKIQKRMIPSIGVPVLSFIIKRINRIALSIWTGRPTIIFSDYSYGLNKLRFHKNFDLYSICMRGADGGCKDLILSIKFLLDSLFFRKTGTMIIVPQYSFATAETVRKVLKITKDPISRAGVKLVQDSLINTVTMHDGLKDDIRKIKTTSNYFRSLKMVDSCFCG